MATAQRLQLHNQSPGLLVLPVIQAVDFNNDTFFAVYCFIKNFIGVTSCQSTVIDNKIQQAMDLIKSHLMFTVREEVEVLKERIVILLDRIKQLEIENDFLKSNASPEVLRALTNGVADYREIEYDSDMKSEDLEVAAIIGNAEHTHVI